MPFHVQRKHEVKNADECKLMKKIALKKLQVRGFVSS